MDFLQNSTTLFEVLSNQVMDTAMMLHDSVMRSNMAKHQVHINWVNYYERVGTITGCSGVGYLTAVHGHGIYHWECAM